VSGGGWGAGACRRSARAAASGSAAVFALRWVWQQAPTAAPRSPRRSVSTVRVLVISRSAYASLERSYPIASRLVLENLRRHTEEAVSREFPG
jgi:hypothetical protein